MNYVILIGRLTKDPEGRIIPGSGTPVSNFTVAVDRNYTKKDGTKETDFIPVEVMGKSAEFCNNYLSKGRLVAIQGSIRVERYQTKDGENKIFTKVFSQNVQALDGKKNKNGDVTFEPHFDNLDPSGFQAIDDDSIPF